MNSQELLAYVRKIYQKFHATRWFRVTYLLLLGLIVAQLYLLTASSVACLVIVLMPVSVFVVPYWLGERKMRNFAVNAAPVFVILIVVGAAMSAQALLSQNEAVPIQSIPGFFSNPNMALADGTVTPYHADPSTTFIFKVKLKTTKADSPTNYSVYLNLTVVRGINTFDRASFNMTPVSVSDNTKNGTWYQLKNYNLTGSVYGYGFSVWDRNKNWTAAGPDFGPLTASGWTYYGFFLYATALSGVTVLAVAFYFVILFMWWYTARARQARARTLGGTVDLPKDAKGSKDVKDVKDVKTKPAQEPGGKAAKVAAFTCTNCGADVTEADDKCPKCGAVFED